MPFGHLEVDDDELRIFGFGMYVSVQKSGIDHVRIARRILVSRISVVFADGVRSDVYFATYGHEGIRAELVARGWPVRLCRG